MSEISVEKSVKDDVVYVPPLAQDEVRITIPEPTIMYPYPHYPLPLPTARHRYYTIYKITYTSNYCSSCIIIGTPVFFWIGVILTSRYYFNMETLQIILCILAVFSSACAVPRCDTRLCSGSLYKQDEVGWSILPPPNHLVKSNVGGVHLALTDDRYTVFNNDRRLWTQTVRIDD